MMTTTRPYLVRAFYDWITDNDCTPHIVVNAEHEDVIVPTEFVEAGQIVLNVSISAVCDLKISNDTITFSAKFNGIAHDIYVPVKAIMAIYARENGRGMVFQEDEDENPPPGGKKNKESTDSKKDDDSTSSKKPHLTVVK